MFWSHFSKLFLLPTTFLEKDEKYRKKRPDKSIYWQVFGGSSVLHGHVLLIKIYNTLHFKNNFLMIFHFQDEKCLKESPITEILSTLFFLLWSHEYRTECLSVKERELRLKWSHLQTLLMQFVVGLLNDIMHCFNKIRYVIIFEFNCYKYCIVVNNM